MENDIRGYRDQACLSGTLLGPETTHESVVGLRQVRDLLAFIPAAVAVLVSQ